MRVIRETRDDMPMQVRNQIAQAREIDLVRFEHHAQRLLDGPYHAHAMQLFGSGKVGHFLDMSIPDNAAEAGIIRIGDQCGATPLVAPQDFAANL